MKQSPPPYALARVPRYTSYPTALQFSDAVGSDRHKAWLAGLGAGDRLSLYIHVPFCAQLCWYCGCHTSVPGQYQRAQRYTDCLVREIETVARHLGPHGGVSQLHFGGGTPTYLKSAEFMRILRACSTHIGSLEQAEIAVEVDPRTLDDERITLLGDLGVTRVNLGVQDFDEGVQRKINRLQSFDLVTRTVKALRTAGVPNIGFDLMYGLPGQTVDSVRRSARQAAALAPDRVAVFGYAHVPWFKKHQALIRETDLPDEGERFAQMRVAAEVWTAAGYMPIGFDHFARLGDSLANAARDGVLARNFQGYTDDGAEAVIGFGASAISALPGGYVQNEPRIGVYRALTADGGLASVRGVAVTADDRLRRDAIGRLMCRFELDMDALCARHDVPRDILADARDRLEGYALDGLCRLDGGHVTIPEKARPFVRVVASSFDAYLSDGTRHSRAV